MKTAKKTPVAPGEFRLILDVPLLASRSSSGSFSIKVPRDLRRRMAHVDAAVYDARSEMHVARLSPSPAEPGVLMGRVSVPISGRALLRAATRDRARVQSFPIEIAPGRPEKLCILVERAPRRGTREDAKMTAWVRAASTPASSPTTRTWRAPLDPALLGRHLGGHPKPATDGRLKTGHQE
jgi:hypothetical protein